ncbi:hypothetical protein BDE02_08G157300 [Populus trichocarpa]|nr:hypothetical protein BDE02_08G157300 [Populus trichocarpa]
MPHLQALAINISPLLTPPLFFLSFSWTLSPDLINLANSIHLKKKGKTKNKNRLVTSPSLLFFSSTTSCSFLFSSSRCSWQHQHTFSPLSFLEEFSRTSFL